MYSLKERKNARRELKRLYISSSDEETRRAAKEQIGCTNWLRRSRSETSFTKQWLEESPVGVMVGLAGFLALMDFAILSSAAFIYTGLKIYEQLK